MTVQPTPQQSPRPRVDHARCRGCKRCLGARICSTGALETTPQGKPPIIHIELCEGCLICVSVCPVNGLAVADPAS